MPSPLGPVVAEGRMRASGQPTLAADGLRVRPWRPDDAPAVLSAYQDPAIQRWHVRTMTDVDEAAAWVRSWPDRWAAGTGADWAVAEDDVVVGRVGFTRIDLWDGLATLAYWVLPGARGRRVAPRAVAAVGTWAFTTLGLHRLELLHSVDNQPSCRVAVAAGFTLEGTLRGRGRHADGWHDMHLHARVAADP